MKQFKKAAALHQALEKDKNAGLSIGFVPTMGALHEGHLSLVRQAKAKNDVVVVSIFINPTQFNDPADFEKYPVTIEQDILLLLSAGCDVLFLPSVAEMYPEPAGTTPPYYALGYLETVLEGAYRPGHFQGVCQVVDKLLRMVKPHHLYMGQKDYQQCMVIRRLLELTGTDKMTELHVVPTQREENGLAMSSRNMRLSKEGRQQAAIIHQVLMQIRKQLRPGFVTSLAALASEKLKERGFRPDYVAIAVDGTLELIEEWDGHQPLVALAAAYLEGVRLIDNVSLKPAS